MLQEEVTFKLYLLEAELKRINATIMLNFQILSFGSRDFVVIPNIFLYSERLKGFKVFPKNLLLGLYKSKIQTVWYVTSSILLLMVCQN